MDAPKIVRITQEINAMKAQLTHAEELIVGMLTCKGLGVPETSTAAYVDFEQIIEACKRVMPELEEEFKQW